MGPTDRFGRPFADWWQRVVAILVDGLIVAIPVYFLAAVVAGAVGSASPGGSWTNSTAAGTIANVIVLAGALLYFGILDGRGQTVGKRALGIAVRSEQTGYPIGIGRAMARRALYVLLWAVFFLPGLLNALSPLWDTKRQAWHDHAVGSVVVKIR